MLRKETLKPYVLS